MLSRTPKEGCGFRSLGHHYSLRGDSRKRRRAHDGLVAADRPRPRDRGGTNRRSRRDARDRPGDPRARRPRGPLCPPRLQRLPCPLPDVGPRAGTGPAGGRGLTRRDARTRRGRHRGGAARPLAPRDGVAERRLDAGCRAHEGGARPSHGRHAHRAHRTRLPLALAQLGRPGASGRTSRGRGRRRRAGRARAAHRRAA